MAAVTTSGTKHLKEHELCMKESPDSSQNAATSGTAKEGQSRLKTGVNQTTITSFTSPTPGGSLLYGIINLKG